MDPTQRWARLYSVGFVLAFVLSVIMLQTDQNLRTDFGALASGYYSHWYVVLITAVADLIGAGLLLLLASRFAIKLGVVGSGLLLLLFLAVVFTYSSVGFGSAGLFARYLFGLDYYGGDIRYLYDTLLAVYLGTFLAGLAILWRTRARPA